MNKKVILLDSTLREGEQTPGVSFTIEEKLEIAKMLDEVGVGMIEAGSPMVSEGVKEAVKRIANESLKAEVIAHVRAVKEDVDLALNCGVDRVAIFMGTSPIHRKTKFKLNEEEIIKRVIEAVEYAKEHGVKVRFTPEDATRTEREYLVRICSAAIEAGADRISVADTVGIMTPDSMYELVSFLSEKLKGAGLDVHCHNDLGLAVANSLAGVKAGANVVHVTVNGLGERAGIAPLSDVAVALKVLMGIDPGIKFHMLTELSSMVERYSGVYLSPHTPIVGSNAFSHKAGVHVAAVLADPSTYEAFDPSILGRSRKIVVDRYAGKHAVKAKLDELGVEVNEEQLEKITRKIKELSDKKKRIENADILAIAEEVLGRNVRGVTPEGVMGIVLVKVESHVYTTNIIRRIINIPGVENAFEVSGEYDIVVYVQTRNMSELNERIEAIRSVRGVERTTTKIVLKRFDSQNKIISK
ncbi:MAG: homocitrate synthase [Candidatus Jordarchaeales archaeon]|nr:homocitrate synthase [Candidatus Jordarchaeia archaeon]